MGLQTSLLTLLCWVGTANVGNAFSIVPHQIQPSLRTLPSYTLNPSATSPTFLNAKKKKRKRRARKKAEEASGTIASSAAASTAATSDTSDLPDFEIQEELVVASVEKVAPAQPQAAAAATTSPPPSAASSSDPDAITPNMMGSTDKPVRSVKDLIADRSLERKFAFDDSDAGGASRETGGGDSEALPDLVEMMRNKQRQSLSPPTPTMTESAPPPVLGKKKARQAERQAAAMAREEQEQDENPLNALKGISFLVDEESGEVTPLKILEVGTWLGIALLLLWEVYINSPFFERAAPVIPIVY